MFRNSVAWYPDNNKKKTLKVLETTLIYMSTETSLVDLVVHVEPYYQKLHRKFSPSYLRGSDWFVGESLITWWQEKQLEILKYKENRSKLMYIFEILYLENAEII